VPILSSADAAQSEYSKYLSQDGSGWMGQILRPFMWSQLKSGAGWQKASLPVYDQKLWNDSGSWVKAPTLKDVADIGVAAVGTIMTAGAAAPAMLAASIGAAALSFGEKALFTGLDYANNLVSSEQAWTQIGKSALSSAFSVATGALGRSLSTGLDGLQGLSATIAKTMTNGAQQFISNAGQAAINSWSYDTDKGLVFDDKAFTESVVGKQALLGYLGGATQTFTSGALTQSIHLENQGFLQGAAGLASSAASEAVQFGASYVASAFSNPAMKAGDIAKAAFDGMGGIDINLADVGAIYGMLSGGGGKSLNSDVTRQNMIKHLSGTGLLDMHLGSDGVSMSLGGGGISLMGDLYKLGTGLTAMDFVKRESASLAASTPGHSADEIYKALGYNYTYGSSDSLALIERLQNGTDSLHLGFDASLNNRVAGFNAANTTAVTVAGANGGRDIYLAGLTDAKMGAVELAHEAMRNGIVGSAANQIQETFSSVLAHTQMAQFLMQNLGSAAFADNSQIRNEVGIYQQFGAKGLAA
jgi:hypothetical protein